MEQLERPERVERAVTEEEIARPRYQGWRKSQRIAGDAARSDGNGGDVAKQITRRSSGSPYFARNAFRSKPATWSHSTKPIGRNAATRSPPATPCSARSSASRSTAVWVNVVATSQSSSTCTPSSATWSSSS
ncbi:MAG: hypothetical protein HYS77_11130 [Candidatus Rokubacteria bacterium]|nr:hypothetical protein [Candidatus Rokubacteria bacterium]